ncbi:adenosylcobyric acid synthase [Amorphus suaedae]
MGNGNRESGRGVTDSIDKTPTPGRAAAVMVQGTGSNVGKSLVVAGLCRLFANKGLAVRPFKPQNMSNNAAATADGGEIGRAQALQARACRVETSVDFNPVLLKPETDIGAQVIVQGRRLTTARAREYQSLRTTLLPRVLESFERVSTGADLVIVEGAGSPAEINLRAGDIANMGFAEAANIPVVVVADIDRGGVIANLVGTHAVLPVAERDRIKGFIVNKFRGDVSLFDDGMAEIARRTSWAPLGVVPYFPGAATLPAEDALDLDGGAHRSGALKVVVPRLPRIANFDDLDPLAQEPGVSVRLLQPGEAMPGDTDLVILTGSKSTVADLAALRVAGWDIDIRAHVRRGGRVIGLCGGYQMLGRTIADPDGIEGPPGTVEGLGLLDVETVLAGDKTTRLVGGTHPETGARVSGYEIHMGRTRGADCARPFLEIEGVAEGAVSGDGRICGTYVHGLFAHDAFRAQFLRAYDAHSDLAYEAAVERTLDELAVHLEACLDADAILAIARGVTR